MLQQMNEINYSTGLLKYCILAISTAAYSNGF